MKEVLSKFLQARNDDETDIVLVKRLENVDAQRIKFGLIDQDIRQILYSLLIVDDVLHLFFSWSSLSVLGRNHHLLILTIFNNQL